MDQAKVKMFDFLGLMRLESKILTLSANNVNESALTLAPLGGPKAPCGFSQIAPEVLGISLLNLPYLSGQQFHTLFQKLGPRS